MKKALILFMILAIFALPSMFALNLNVQSLSPNAVLIKNINHPMSFNISVTNNGPADNLKFYNLLGFLMTPKNSIPFSHGETKTVNITIMPITNLSFTGYYTFNYFIQGSSGDSVPESLTFRMINLADAFNVGASEINPQSNSIKIYIQNNVNYNFGNVNVDFKSPFFTLDKNVMLGPNQEQSFDITLNKTAFKSLLAGFYTLSADVTYGNKITNVAGNIKFSEKDILNATEKNYGFIIFTKEITKTNGGNVVVNSQTIVQKNIISRLFTTFNIQPDTVARRGLNIYYTWNNQIQPGDTLTIYARTNWLLPLFVMLFIVAIVIIVKQFSKTALSMDKKVTFLRAKGGEFAMKVTVVVSAKKFVERITVTERLPLIVKLYEKFGMEKPSKVDVKNKRIEWYFDHLEEGESRVINYIIYSKVGVLGRFALPTASAVYERDGKIYEAESNRAFLVVEQSSVKED